MTGRSTDPTGPPDPVDLDVVARLVADQLGSRGPLHRVAQGWDNAIVRLGERVLRFPVRAEAVPLIRHEARWLAEVAAPLPVAAPVPSFVGAPGHGYPWPWTVAQWIDGDTLQRVPTDQRGGVVDGLASTLLALHRPAPAEAPVNPVRGVPLAMRAPVVGPRLDAWHGTAEERAVLRAVYDRALAATAYTGPALWLHGDPHPANLLVRDGGLAGVIDFGDLGAGDPASDLAAAWWCFGADDRARLRARLEREGRYDDQVWTRAAGWAASWVSAIGPDDPLLPIARHTVEQLRLG